MTPTAMFKLERLTEGNTTVLRLVGRINAQHLDELSKLIAEARHGVKLDLAEVTLVDVEAIRFFCNQEREGVQIANCSRYVREWIQRERASNQTAEAIGKDKEEIIHGHEEIYD